MMSREVRVKTGALVASAVIVAGLAACTPETYNDAAGFTVVNESEATIWVSLVSPLSREHRITVGPGTHQLLPTDRCIDGRILVRTEGSEVADLEGPACPASVLRVLDQDTAVIEMMFS